MANRVLRLGSISNRQAPCGVSLAVRHTVRYGHLETLKPRAARRRPFEAVDPHGCETKLRAVSTEGSWYLVCHKYTSGERQVDYITGLNRDRFFFEVSSHTAKE
jgi:hypothetical protein